MEGRVGIHTQTARCFGTVALETVAPERGRVCHLLTTVYLYRVGSLLTPDGVTFVSEKQTLYYGNKYHKSLSLCLEERKWTYMIDGFIYFD